MVINLHRVGLRVFSKEDEDFEKIKEKLLEFFPFNLEDEKVESKMLSFTLDHSGFDFKAVKNGEEALKIIKKELLRYFSG